MTNGSGKRGSLRPSHGPSRVPFFIILALIIISTLLVANYWTLSNQRDLLQDKLSRLNRDHNVLSQSKLDIDSELEQTKKKLDETKEKLQVADASIKESKGEKEDHAKEIAELQANIKKLKAENELTGSNAQEQSAKLEALQADVDKYKTAFDKCSHEYESLKVMLQTEAPTEPPLTTASKKNIIAAGAATLKALVQQAVQPVVALRKEKKAAQDEAGELNVTEQSEVKSPAASETVKPQLNMHSNIASPAQQVLAPQKSRDITDTQSALSEKAKPPMPPLVQSSALKNESKGWTMLNSFAKAKDTVKPATKLPLDENHNGKEATDAQKLLENHQIEDPERGEPPGIKPNQEEDNQDGQVKPPKLDDEQLNNEGNGQLKSPKLDRTETQRPLPGKVFKVEGLEKQEDKEEIQQEQDEKVEKATPKTGGSDKLVLQRSAPSQPLPLNQQNLVKLADSQRQKSVKIDEEDPDKVEEKDNVESPPKKEEAVADEKENDAAVKR